LPSLPPRAAAATPVLDGLVRLRRCQRFSMTLGIKVMVVR
jgi:hypothetical protein